MSRIDDETDDKGKLPPFAGNTWAQQIDAERERASAAEVRLNAQVIAARVLLTAQQEAASVLADAEGRAASVLLMAASEAMHVLDEAHQRAMSELLSRATSEADQSFTPEGELLVRFADTAQALQLAQQEAAAKLKDVQQAAADILIGEQRRAAELLVEARYNYLHPVMPDEE